MCCSLFAVCLLFVGCCGLLFCWYLSGCLVCLCDVCCGLSLWNVVCCCLLLFVVVRCCCSLWFVVDCCCLLLLVGVCYLFVSACCCLLFVVV